MNLDLGCTSFLDVGLPASGSVTSSATREPPPESRHVGLFNILRSRRADDESDTERDEGPGKEGT